MESKKMLGDVKGISGMTTHHPARPESAHLSKNRELGAVGLFFPNPFGVAWGVCKFRFWPQPQRLECVCVCVGVRDLARPLLTSVILLGRPTAVRLPYINHLREGMTG